MKIGIDAISNSPWRGLLLEHDAKGEVTNEIPAFFDGKQTIIFCQMAPEELELLALNKGRFCITLNSRNELGSINIEVA